MASSGKSHQKQDVKKERGTPVKEGQDDKNKSENGEEEKQRDDRRGGKFQNRRGGGRNHPYGGNQRGGHRGGFGGGGGRDGSFQRDGGPPPFRGDGPGMGGMMGDFMGEQNDGPKEPKKFTGRCRLFVGNITPETTEEQFKEMFAEYGEVSEVFVNAARGFGFIRLDFRINAERAKVALDGKMRNNRVLRVRFATHGAALKVTNLSPFVSNELLEEAFSQFGEVERAVVCVDDRGRSCSEGIVEFARKPGAQSALKRINEGVFLLSSYPRPIRVEPLEQRDEEDGLTEKFVQRNEGFRKDREKEPRFAPQGSFEFEFGMKHRRIDDMERENIERVKQEMELERTRLAEEMETAIFDYQADQIRQDLMRQQEELKRLDEMKNEHMRRRQEMDMRRREQGLLGNDIMRQEEERRREMMMRASNNMGREGGPPPPMGPGGPGGQPPNRRPEEMMMRGGPPPPGMREGGMPPHEGGMPGSPHGPSQRPSGPGTPPMPPPPVPPGMNMEQQNRPGGMEGRFGGPGGMPEEGMEHPEQMQRGGPPPGQGPRFQGPPPGPFPQGPGGPGPGPVGGPGGNMFNKGMPGNAGNNPNMGGNERRREGSRRDDFDMKRMRRF